MYEVQLRSTEPLQVASIGHTGPYQELGPIYQQLQKWIADNRVQPNGFIREIGYDNPMQTPPDQCRQEVCVPVSSEVKTENGIELKRLPELKVISVVHKGGLDFQSLGPAYQALMGWAVKEGKKTNYSIMTYYTPPHQRENAEVEIALVVE